MRGKHKPTLEQLQPVFFAVFQIVQDAGGTLEIMPQQLFKRVLEVAPPEAKTSPVFPRGKISTAMSVWALRPLFNAAGIRVSRPRKAEGAQMRPFRFMPLDSNSQQQGEEQCPKPTP